MISQHCDYLRLVPAFTVALDCMYKLGGPPPHILDLRPVVVRLDTVFDFHVFCYTAKELYLKYGVMTVTRSHL